jgi:hypothetical protein
MIWSASVFCICSWTVGSDAVPAVNPKVTFKAISTAANDHKCCNHIRGKVVSCRQGNPVSVLQTAMVSWEAGPGGMLTAVSCPNYAQGALKIAWWSPVNQRSSVRVVLRMPWGGGHWGHPHKRTEWLGKASLRCHWGAQTWEPCHRQPG